MRSNLELSSDDRQNKLEEVIKILAGQREKSSISQPSANIWPSLSSSYSLIEPEPEPILSVIRKKNVKTYELKSI